MNITRSPLSDSTGGFTLELPIWKHRSASCVQQWCGDGRRSEASAAAVSFNWPGRLKARHHSSLTWALPGKNIKQASKTAASLGREGGRQRQSENADKAATKTRAVKGRGGPDECVCPELYQVCLRVNPFTTRKPGGLTESLYTTNGQLIWIVMSRNSRCLSLWLNYKLSAFIGRTA